MKKVLFMALCLMFLASVGYGATTTTLTLDVTPLEAVSIAIDVSSLTGNLQVGNATYICGTLADPDAGQNPCPLISNLGASSWDLSVQFHDDGIWTYSDSWDSYVEDTITLGMAVSDAGSIAGTNPMLEDTLYPSPWGAVPEQGVAIATGESVRLWIVFEIMGSSTVIGATQTVVLTFGCIV